MNYYAPTFVGTAMTLLCGVFDSSGFYFKIIQNYILNYHIYFNLYFQIKRKLQWVKSLDLFMIVAFL